MGLAKCQAPVVLKVDDTIQWKNVGKTNNRFTSVSIWVLRSNIGFAFSTLNDWFKKLMPLFHPIRSKTKTNHDSLVRKLVRVFPHVASATCNYFVFWLVHLIICVLCDWLSGVITLVLVLQHSIENCSTILL